MAQVRTNKRILIFADETIVGDHDSLGLGILVVAAKDVPSIETAILREIGALTAPMGELHAAKNSASLTRLILDALAAPKLAAKTVRVLATHTARHGVADAYFAALRKGAVAALKLYKRNVLRSDVINNADLYVDEISMAPQDGLNGEFARIREQHAGSFKAIRKIVLIDSAISRSLQFADAIAYSAQPGFAAKPADFDRWGIVRV